MMSSDLARRSQSSGGTAASIFRLVDEAARQKKAQRTGTGATAALMGGSGPQESQNIFQRKIRENTF
jgi:hypothetical protein